MEALILGAPGTVCAGCRHPDGDHGEDGCHWSLAEDGTRLSPAGEGASYCDCMQAGPLAVR
jgi:hypothetical protein